MKWIKTTVLILLILIGGIFGALSFNQEEVALKFAIWQTPVALPVFWWLLLLFVVGVLVGVLAGAWAGTKRRLELRKLRRELRDSNAELARLRDLTLQG